MRVADRPWAGDVNTLRNTFGPAICNALRGYGINTNGGLHVVEAIYNGQRSTAKTSFDNALRSLKRLANTQDIPLILVALPNKDAGLYSDVKWWGDCCVGIPSICITQQTTRKYQEIPKGRNNMMANLW